MKIEPIVGRAKKLYILLKKHYQYMMMLIFIGIYLFLFKSYVDGSICTANGSFVIVSLVYLFASIILCIRQCREKLIIKCPILQHSNVVVFFIIPLLAFYVVEVIYNPTFSTIPFIKVLINYLMFLGLQVGIYLLSHNCRFTYSSILSFAWVFGVANYYVMKFKGNPLLPADLFSYKTAMSVVGNYNFELSDSIIYGCILVFYGFCIIKCFVGRGKSCSFIRKLGLFVIGIGHIYVLACLLFYIRWSETLDIYVDAWTPENTYYQNGGTFSFLLELQEMHVEKPKGYSEETVTKILNAYNVNVLENHENLPSVIVIMNESFADLNVLGEVVADNVLANVDDLDSYIMKGNVYASVNGGGTCNSEFEFLTGHSMANFSSSSIYPYQMYNLENTSNLAASFAEYGYETLAIHPAEAKNWERERVYQQLGFQDFISLEDMKDVQKIRAYASDSYNYQQIINAYECKEAPIFIFNITMQNHGGYTDKMTELEPVEIEEKYQKYEDVIQYMTLVKESDRAFAELLSYFSEVEEPVIICMFGDHQPALNAEFISEVMVENGRDLEVLQNRFITPYVIWCNYDTEIQNIKKDMSLNYLGANILELAGINNTYAEYLLDLQEKIPVINSKGYQTIEGEWFNINEPNTLMDQYRNIQYYLLFDN